nr:hypothetical protein [Tanacetum cinerariifolium]
MRMDRAAAKPCQGDSSEFYLITASIYTDKWGTVVITNLFDKVTKTLSSISMLITNLNMQVSQWQQQVHGELNSAPHAHTQRSKVLNNALMMTTHNASRRTTASQGGRTGGKGRRTGEQTGRGDGQTGDQGGRGNESNGDIDEVLDFSTIIAQQFQDLLPTIVAQVGYHISNQVINESRNDNTADDSIHKDVRNVNVNNGWNGYSYKEFVAYKSKEFDGKGGVVQIRGREATVDMTWEDFKALMKEEYCPSNEMKKLVPHLVTPETKRIERVGTKMVTPLNAKNPTTAQGACYEYGGTDHYKSACLRLNRAPGQGGNHQNQALTIEGGQGRGNNGNPVRGRAFVMGAEESRQDLNIVTGTFSLNNHYSTMLSDYGANYSFVSTTFIPMLDIKPSSLGTDWLSRHKAEIIFHEKVVRIPLPHGEMLRVHEERPDEKAKPLMKIEFCIDLIPRVMSVAKSPYRLAPTEMEEFSNQLKEL